MTTERETENDDAEVLFALQMATEHNERHQALALRTWLPRIEQWYNRLLAADAKLNEPVGGIKRFYVEGAVLYAADTGHKEVGTRIIETSNGDWVKYADHLQAMRARVPENK